MESPLAVLSVCFVLFFASSSETQEARGYLLRQPEIGKKKQKIVPTICKCKLSYFRLGGALYRPIYIHPPSTVGGAGIASSPVRHMVVQRVPPRFCGLVSGNGYLRQLP